MEEDLDSGFEETTVAGVYTRRVVRAEEQGAEEHVGVEEYVTWSTSSSEEDDDDDFTIRNFYESQQYQLDMNSEYEPDSDTDSEMEEEDLSSFFEVRFITKPLYLRTNEECLSYFFSQPLLAHSYVLVAPMGDAITSLNPNILHTYIIKKFGTLGTGYYLYNSFAAAERTVRGYLHLQNFKNVLVAIIETSPDYLYQIDSAFLDLSKQPILDLVAKAYYNLQENLYDFDSPTRIQMMTNRIELTSILKYSMQNHMEILIRNKKL